ncbi:choline kinase cytoplasm [Scleroderma citrinum]
MTFLTESLSSAAISLASSSDIPIALIESTPASFAFKHEHPFRRTSSSASLCASEVPRVDIVNGLRNAHVKLNLRSSSSETLSRLLLSLFIALRVPGWDKAPLSPSSLSIRRSSGALMNEVYFVSSLSSISLPTLLLRIYGSSANSLISRSRELHTLHTLSSRYHIGPRIYGTFTNGRIEEYFDSITLTPRDIRDKIMNRWIAVRMAEFHSISISAVEGPLAISSQEGKSWEIGVEKNIKTWLQPAREVLAHPNMNQEDRTALNIDNFIRQWSRYMRWLSRIEKVEGPSKRVFAHNDLHSGNLLRLNSKLPQGTPDHCQIVVVDFEYAAPNPRAFDIANYFQEWMTDYQSSEPHQLRFSLYPTREERWSFYEAYLSHASSNKSGVPVVVREASMVQLEREVCNWSPACAGMWAIWSIVKAKDDVERGIVEGELDYIAHAKCRMAAFFRGVEELI